MKNLSKTTWTVLGLIGIMILTVILFVISGGTQSNIDNLSTGERYFSQEKQPEKSLSDQCREAGGEWKAGDSSSECIEISEDWCSERDGSFDECRNSQECYLEDPNDPSTAQCTDVCVPVCSLEK